MQDFLAVAWCAAVFVVCFAVMKKARRKKAFQIYPSGGSLKMEQGVL